MVGLLARCGGGLLGVLSGAGCASPDLPAAWESPGLGVLSTRMHPEDSPRERLVGELGLGAEGSITADVFDEGGGPLNVATAWAFLPIGTPEPLDALDQRCEVVPSESPCILFSDTSTVSVRVGEDVEALLNNNTLVRFAGSVGGSALNCLSRRLSDQPIAGQERCVFGSTVLRFGPRESLLKAAREQGLEVEVSDEELDTVEARPNLIPHISSVSLSGPAEPSAPQVEEGDEVEVEADEVLHIDVSLENVDEPLWNLRSGSFESLQDEHEFALFVYGDPSEVEVSAESASIVVRAGTRVVVIAVVRDGIGNAISRRFSVIARG